MFRETSVQGVLDSVAFCQNMALSLASAKEGNTLASTWSSGGSFVFWELANGVMYLSGTGESFKEGFSDLFSAHIRPWMTERKWRGLSLVCKDEEIHGAIPGLLGSTRCTEANEILLVGRALPHECDDARTVVPIDASFLESGARNVAAVDCEIRKMWPSKERFLENGFGFASVVDSELVSWCTAEFLSSRSCGAGIETDERFQGNGHGTAVAEAFVREAERRELVPHWCTDEKNAASLRVAEKAGFVRAEIFKAWNCELVS